MENRPVHRKIIQIPLLLLVFLLQALPAPALALDLKDDIPSLEIFVQDVMNGEPEDLRGLYIPDVLADEIVRQPEGMPAYVSSKPGEITQFSMAEEYGTFGLLAHNYLAGEAFSDLESRQVLYLVYGDGEIEKYSVRQVLRYQALTSHSITSDFIDLETGERLSASKLFLKVFNRPGEVVLQTCIYADGDASWGRLFIIAVPVDEHDPGLLPAYFSFH
jgi:hypothetical protein